MKPLILATAAALLATAAVAQTAPAQAPAARPAAAPPLAVGDIAPDFTAKAYLAGQPTEFNLKKALKNGPVVLYFFPGAYTTGCNIEAKQFADAADSFKKAGATVVGMTGGFGTSDRQGPPAANLDEAVKDFSSTHCNGKFPVAIASADTIAAYKAILTQRPGWSNRTSYVITRDDKIALAFVNLGPDGHVANTLKAVEDLKGKKG